MSVLSSQKWGERAFMSTLDNCKSSPQKEVPIMGKFARVIARTHDLTTDNIVDGTKALGRGLKKVTAPVGHKVADSFNNGISAVKEEHAIIERERAAKKAIEAKAHAAYEAELARGQHQTPTTA